MLSLICSGTSVGGDVKAVDDRRWAIIPINLESQGEVFRMWGGNGGGVSGSPSIDTEWEISKRDTASGDQITQRISTNIQDSYSNSGGAKELSSQGVLGTGSDTDGN